jgi:hypothetical protein
MFSSDQSLITNALPISVDFPRDQQDFINTISLLYKRIANAVNAKESALYLLEELATFKLYFTSNDPLIFRNVYRKTFDMVNLNGGNIGAGATVSVAHGINGIVACTLIFGTATTSDVPVRYVPLPYVSQIIAENIQIYLTPTNVVLVNGNSILTQAYITAEYVKNQ